MNRFSRHSTATALLLALAACNDNKFKDSNNPQGQPTPAPSQAGSNPAVPSPAPTAGCTTAGTTVVKLLTQSVLNKQPNQVIRYELSMNDCQGVQTPIKADVILFDINALYYGVTAGNFGNPLPYTLQSLDGATLSTGRLDIVQGSDLFGVTNPQHWHYRTNNPTNIATGTNKVIMNVDISNSENHRPDTPPGGPYPPQETISTFLRFGNAQPVEQPVTFQNK